MPLHPHRRRTPERRTRFCLFNDSRGLSCFGILALLLRLHEDGLAPFCPRGAAGQSLPLPRSARAINSLSFQLKPAGTACRDSSNSCDLPEFCTGASPHCPANVYLHDGHPCQGVDGYCYNGICQTHEQQCITLWGPGRWLPPVGSERWGWGAHLVSRSTTPAVFHLQNFLPFSCSDWLPGRSGAMLGTGQAKMGASQNLS